MSEIVKRTRVLHLIEPMQSMHESITPERIKSLMRPGHKLSGTYVGGVCIACGTEQLELPYDAYMWPCDTCGSHGVVGFDELIPMVERRNGKGT